MASKIKVDTIENVAGSGNVSLGSGHNLVVPGNQTVGGTLGVTGASTLTGDTQVTGNLGVGVAPERKFHVEGSGAEFSLVDTSRPTDKKTMNMFIDANGKGNIRMLNDAQSAGNAAITIEGSSPHTSPIVRLPYQPAFMAFKVGNQTIGAVTTQVTGWNANLDVGSNWDNSQNRYTVPTDGIYLAGGFYQASGTTGLHFGILKNGGAYGNDSYLDVTDAAANGYSVPFTMAANDYFTWIAYNSVSKSINANRSKIWVIKVA